MPCSDLSDMKTNSTRNKLRVALAHGRVCAYTHTRLPPQTLTSADLMSSSSLSGMNANSIRDTQQGTPLKLPTV